MLTLLEVIALVTLGGLGAAFFARRIRRGSAVALVLSGLCVLLALPQGASATEFRNGSTVSVASDETIKGDMFIFAERTRIEGTVDGDLYVFSHDVNVDGHVTGDVIGFVQTLRIAGKVDGNIRSGTNSVTITGSIGRNALMFCDGANLDSTAKVGGSITAFVGALDIDGAVGRDLLLFSRHTTVSGKVGGAIRAKGSSLSIGSGAEIDGPVRYEGENAPQVASGAKLASPVDYTKWERTPTYRSRHYYMWQVIWAAAFMLFGLVLFSLMPKFSQEAVAGAEQYGASFGLGVLVFFALPIAAVIACVTVVGLLLGISTLMVWFASLFLAQIVVGGIVGQWFLGRTGELWPLIGRMVLGVAMVRLCTTIPHVGGWVKFAVILWGMGAISLALYRRFQPRISPSAPPPFVPTPLPPNVTVGGIQP